MEWDQPQILISRPFCRAWTTPRRRALFRIRERRLESVVRGLSFNVVAAGVTEPVLIAHPAIWTMGKPLFKTVLAISHRSAALSFTPSVTTLDERPLVIESSVDRPCSETRAASREKGWKRILVIIDEQRVVAQRRHVQRNLRESTGTAAAAICGFKPCAMFLASMNVAHR